jgi:hypothetical protein
MKPGCLCRSGFWLRAKCQFPQPGQSKGANLKSSIQEPNIPKMGCMYGEEQGMLENSTHHQTFYEEIQVSSLERWPSSMWGPHLISWRVNFKGMSQRQGQSVILSPK